MERNRGGGDQMERDGDLERDRLDDTLCLYSSRLTTAENFRQVRINMCHSSTRKEPNLSVKSALHLSIRVQDVEIMCYVMLQIPFFFVLLIFFWDLVLNGPQAI